MSASEDHVSAGYEFLRDSMYHAALTEFGQAEELTPDDAMVHYYLGHTFWRLEMTLEAQTAFECALQLDPDGSQLLLDLGVFYLDCGQESKAKPLISRACESSTDAGTTSFALARLAYSRKDYPEALRQYQAANEWVLDRPNLAGALGATLMQLKRYQEAHEVLQSVALRPDASAPSLYNLALCERRLGNEAEARQLLERATKVDPYDYSVYAALAGLYFRKHEWKSGFRYARLSWLCSKRK